MAEFSRVDVVRLSHPRSFAFGVTVAFLAVFGAGCGGGGYSASKACIADNPNMGTLEVAEYCHVWIDLYEPGGSRYTGG